MNKDKDDGDDDYKDLYEFISETHMRGGGSYAMSSLMAVVSSCKAFM